MHQGLKNEESVGIFAPFSIKLMETDGGER